MDVKMAHIFPANGTGHFFTWAILTLVLKSAHVTRLRQPIPSTAFLGHLEIEIFRHPKWTSFYILIHSLASAGRPDASSSLSRLVPSYWRTSKDEYRLYFTVLSRGGLTPLLVLRVIVIN